MPSQQSLAHVDALETLYRESVTALRTALSRYLSMKPDAVDAAYIRQMIS